MMKHYATALFTAILLLSVGLAGCPKPTGYFGRVTAHLTPQPVDFVRAAWLCGMGGFEGPLKMQSADPNCSYYTKRLPTAGVVGVHDCYGPMKDYSETGWGYRVSVSTWTEGQREEVRKEIDQLVDEIWKVIRAQVRDAKVTKQTGPMGMPF